MIELGDLTKALNEHCLCILGGFARGTDTVLMIGPDEHAGFWNHFNRSLEAHDGQRNGMDRWSLRVLEGLATRFKAKAYFPFGGPPYHPFYTWAIDTGRIHESPIKLLVHDQAGLWVSFRGALRVPGRLELPPAPPSPCLSCVGQPCLTACPAGALGADGYDVPRCKDYLRSKQGQTCMTQGCQARRACPIGQNWNRKDEQSAFHMAAFCPK